MGQEYGMLPTDVMDRPARDFWTNSRIRRAGRAWEQRQRERAQQSGGAGAATKGQQEDLVDDQEARADQREQQDGQPDLDDQLDALGGGDPSRPSTGGR